MTTYQSYSSRYSKSRDKKIRSTSPHHVCSEDNKISTDNKQVAGNQLGNIVSKLCDRVDGIEVKITSLTNIIKLLQKYTETRDQQYQKQKQNEEFRSSIGQRVDHIESLSLDNKIKQFQALSQKVRSQITAIQSIRIGLARQKSKKQQETPINRIQSQKQLQNFNDLHSSIQEMETNLRQEMNKKIQICMNYFKKTIEHCDLAVDSHEAKFASPKTVNSMNSLMLQEQLHTLNLTVNKLESDCARNKMIADKKFEQIISYVGEIKKNAINRNTTSRSRRNRSRSISASRNDLLRTTAKNQDNKSQKSSISKRSKSISRKKIDSKNTEKIEDKKRQKQNELKQALRRKKQNQEKLKMKK